DAKNRYCTAEFKRNQIGRVITQLVHDHPAFGTRPVRVLNALGIRAAESPARRKRGESKPQIAGLPCWVELRMATKVITSWWPIFRLSTREVWAAIAQAGTPVHPAYRLGMSRLSCVFCVFAPKAALVLAGKHNPELLRRYAQVEAEIGHRFQNNLAIADVLRAVEAGEQAGAITTWEA